MITHDYPWLSMITHDYPWLSMITHDYPWLPMITHDYPWLPMITHGFFQWPHWDSDEVLCWKIIKSIPSRLAAGIAKVKEQDYKE